MAEKKKMGRPTNDPKPHRISIRLSDETMEILNAYCKKRGISYPEGAREAINRLKNET